VLTQAQLVSLGAVTPTLANAPAHPFQNTMLRTFDANFSYPIHWRKLPASMSLEPSVAIYNVFNFANYKAIGSSSPVTPDGGTLQTVADASTGNVNGPLGDPKNDAYNQARVSRRTGTFDQGAPRATEFQLKFNF
jgi:hypothetical protein